MDRNTVIGFVLLALLFFGYFYYTSQGEKAAEKQKLHIQDSLNRLKPKVDTTLKMSSGSDSLNAKRDSSTAGITQDSVGKEQLVTLEK